MNTIPTVTKNLLIINVLMFLGTIVAQSYGIDLAQYLGLHFFLAEDFNAAQLITYMYFRAGMGAKTISVLLSGVRYRSRNYPGGGTVYSL